MTFKKDIIQLYILFALAVLVTYKMPQAIGLIFQIILLIIFWRSKRDYFWLAFVFIIQNFPGGLFSRYTNDIQHTFSLLQSSPAGTLYFWMVFIIIAFIKSLKIKSKYEIIVINNIKILFVYFLILLVTFGIYKITAVSRTLLPWLFLFVLPKLMSKKKDYVNFFNLIFSFVFFVFFSQIFQIIFRITVAKALGGSMTLVESDELSRALRPWDGIFIPLLAIMGSLFFITFKDKYFNKNYLILILGLSIFSIFITATRMWIISSMFILFAYIYSVAKNKTFIIKRFVLPLIFILVLINTIPVLSQQVSLSLKRFETLQYLMKGDLTAGGTLKRLDIRRPRVLNKFYQSPVIGWGYGKVAREYSDLHVGNENMLLHTGLIGYSLWLWLWLTFIFKLLRLNMKLSYNNPYKNVPKVFIIFFIAILILHSSAQWFGYQLSFLAGYTIIFLFSFASFVYSDSLSIEYYKKESK